MKGAILATAAAFAGAAMADVAHMRRHGHEALHHRAVHPSAPEESCECTTEVITLTGEPTLVPIPTSETTVTSETTTTIHSTSYSTVTVIVTPTPTLPTPGLTSFTEPGTYTIPATTITVTDTTTVCGATTTELPSGTHTYGGVTTIVETETTIVCPYATVKPSGSTVTSVIETTTYVCPSAGTYTIAPTTTYVPTSTVVVYPTPATFTPGTYTQPGQTVTVTRTDYTYVCPYTNGDEPTTTAPAPVTTTAAPVTTTTTTKTTTTSKVPSSTSTVDTPKPTGVNSGSATMGMTYSPYSNEGGCKAKGDIYSDVATIKNKGFTHLRVYSTDCNSLEWIGGAARENGLSLIIGVFIDNTGIAGAQDQVTDICDWAEWDLVDLIVVGNEAIQNGFCDAGSLAGFIGSSKEAFAAAGYSGQITTTEPINIWQQSGSALCGAIDIIGANIHPFFNSEVSAAKAGDFVVGQISILKDICPGLDVINLETGWPSAGSANGAAIPTVSEQAIAIKSLISKVGTKSVFFSYTDDLWKEPGQFDVERSWGCIDQF